MKYARLTTENIIIETFVPPEGFAIEECFTPEIVAQFEPCPDEVEQNWKKQDDGTYIAPPPPPEPAPEPPAEEP